VAFTQLRAEPILEFGSEMDEQGPNPTWPLFAYGLLQPGELGWLRLRNTVKCVEPAEVEGVLRMRDGLLLLDDGSGRVDGWLLRFDPEHAQSGYESVSDLERHLYRWESRQAVTASGRHLAVNVLVGRSPSAGSHLLDEPWTTERDPLFREGRRLVDALIDEANQAPAPPDPPRVLRLQAAYGLLWSIIERYITIRYDVGEAISPKLKLLAEDPVFATSLAARVERQDVVIKSTDPSEKKKLIPTNPHKSIGYYYAVRSNAAHRGKAAFDDVSRIDSCLAELSGIFDDVFRNALDQAMVPAPRC
jgi:hypothetical protein